MRHRTASIVLALCTMLLGYGVSQDSHHEPAAAMDHTAHAMSSRQVDAGPHMKLTPLRARAADDQAKAEKIVARTRQALEKYRDYRVALNDGYKIFLPQIPMKMKHFTKYRYAMEAATQLNPERPTSLLYEQKGDDYKLIGAMFTAPARLTEDELNARLPLSVARWHLHVNMCAPPREKRAEMFKRNAKFGLAGSIHTLEACEAAGGRFFPHVFGWMVHVYPFEKTEEDIWSVARQMDHKH